MTITRRLTNGLGTAAMTLCLTAGAQVYFTEDFEGGDTEAHVAKGWVFDKNEFAFEVGTDFGVATEPFDPENFPAGRAPGSSNSDPDTGLPLIHPPGVRGWVSSGNFLLSDSDSGGGSDDVGSGSEFWAITPSFSTVGSTEAWFHADLTIANNNNGECIWALESSVDGGQTWTQFWVTAEPQRPWQAWQRGALAGNEELDGAAFMDGYPVLGSASTTKTWTGVYGRVHFKLPTEANNQADVKIRFMLHEAGDAWYLAADNILVDNSPPPVGSQTVLSEGFESGIPSTWKTISVADEGWSNEPLKDANGDWRRLAGGVPIHIDLLREAEKRRTVDGADLPAEAMQKWDTASFDAYPELSQINPNGATDGRWITMLADGNYALRQEGDSLDEVAHLQTPVLDLSQATNVYLDFVSELLIYGGPVNAEVFVSVDGGENFTQIFTYRGALMDLGEAPYFTHHYIPVPEAAGKSAVVFQFTSSGGDPEQYRGFWAIDDVRVSIDPEGGTTAPALSIDRSGANVTVTFEGTLQEAGQLGGPWTDLPGTSPLTIEPTDPNGKFYRAVQ